jgi:hypothetical protein
MRSRLIRYATVTLVASLSTLSSSNAFRSVTNSGRSYRGHGTPLFSTVSVSHADAEGKKLFIDASIAKAIDDDLMSTEGFSLDQLMELAGLSVATAADHFLKKIGNCTKNKILVIIGPGNNGGDGLVRNCVPLFL